MLTGDTKFLKSSTEQALVKLASKRSSPRVLINYDIARKAASLASDLGVLLGLILGRNGQIFHVIVGSSDRLYLPDLGRYRLGKARLRRLRLIVFDPRGEAVLHNYRNDSSYPGGVERVMSPEIAADFITDLEKLRLDLVATAAVSASGNLGSFSVAYLSPDTRPLIFDQATNVQFFHFPELRNLELDVEEFIAELEGQFQRQQTETFDVSKDHALLVGAYTGTLAEAEASITELAELARTAEVQIMGTVVQRRRKLDPKSVVGKGKLEDICLEALDKGADVLIFDRELTPAQLRFITDTTELRVIDRSMLILDIFAQRAVSSEGRLQVELAQLRYSLPRLAESASGLSRLTGGIGGRGPGETKLEIGRRRARDRITMLEKKISKIAKQRGVRRGKRKRRGVPVVAIVGYTNAGKSTLLNALTKSETFVQQKLFATLDPSSRRMKFPNDREVVFVDTVGFIRELPKELVTAFRATLEEIGEADVLIHVVDASSVEKLNQIDVVNRTLEDLGYVEKPSVLVMNKCDLLSDVEVRMLENSLGAISISSVKRLGFSKLLAQVQDMLAGEFEGMDPGSFISAPQGVSSQHS